MADDLGEVGLETVVRAVDDEVRGERRGGPVGVGGGPVRVRLRDLVEPVGQLRCRARVERGEGADDAGLALGGDELRADAMNIGEPTTGSRRRRSSVSNRFTMPPWMSEQHHSN